MWPPETTRARNGKLGRVVLEEGGVDVALEVVHADQGQAARIGERLGHRAADQQRADQPGALGHGDAVEVAEPDRRPVSSARRTTGTITSRWRREASSGTTPP